MKLYGRTAPEAIEAKARTLLGTLLPVLLSSLLALPASAGETDGDVVFKALDSELQRSMKKLKLPGHEPPYYIGYSQYETDDFSVEASLGAITTVSRQLGRSLFPSVRVGSYQFDNSHFSGSQGSRSAITDSFCPVDDNYDAIRRCLWLKTDSRYKMAVEDLEEKKAFLLARSLAESEQLPDFSRVAPLDFVKPVFHLRIDQEKWKGKVRTLSSIFREFPEIRESWVRFDQRILNSWMVTSEMSQVRTSENACRFLVSASTQTPDGSIVFDGCSFLAHSRNGLPPYEEIEKGIRGLCLNLRNLGSAPLIDDYEGPVLFEGQAAAEFFGQVLAPRIVAERRELSEFSDRMPPATTLSNKLGRRVMPTFLSVVDDPLARYFGGQQLFGYFDVDGEGVRGQRITIVDRGYLRTICSGRTPTRHIKESNGHGVAGDGETVAKNSSIFIQSERSFSRRRLLRELSKLGKESGLDYVLIVRRISNASRETDGSDNLLAALRQLSGSTVGISDPVLVYRHYLKDGHEELVRGGHFCPTTIRVLKDIVATGNDTGVYAVEGSPNSYFHVITPSILVGEMEVERSRASRSNPPVLRNPLWELGTGAAE